MRKRRSANSSRWWVTAALIVSIVYNEILTVIVDDGRRRDDSSWAIMAFVLLPTHRNAHHQHLLHVSNPKSRKPATRRSKQKSPKPPGKRSKLIVQKQPAPKISARELLEQAQQQQTLHNNLTQSECDNLIATCVSQDEWDLVLGVLELMKKDGLQQVRSTYRACLHACSEVANAASCQEILRAMKEAGFELGVEEYAATIHCLCRKNKQEHVFWRSALQLQQEFASLEKGDLPLATYNALLSCVAKEGQWRESVRLLKHMERPCDDKTMPSLSSYRAVIESCAAAKQAVLAVQFLQSCHDVSGLTPTTFLFGVVISALSDQLQWRRCLQLLDLMDKMKVPKNLSIYNAILTSCSRAREPAQAKSVLARMRRVDRIDPDIVSFNCVLSACASASHWKDALKILDQAHRQPGVTPDVYTYTNAIRACAKGRQKSRALTLLRVMKDKGLPLDAYAYTAAIEACDWRGALELVSEMESKGIEPSEVTYSVAIKACGAGGQWKVALGFLDAMRIKSMPINVYVYNAAITALAKAAKQQGKKSNSTAAPLYPEVETLMNQMQKDGIAPDGFTYSTAISCCGQEGRWEDALAIMEKMRKGGPRTQPNRVAYTAAIASCGKAGRADDAIQLFRQLQEQGLSADLVAYNALFAALRVGIRPDEAYQYWNILLDRWRENGPSVRQQPRTNTSLHPDIITITNAIGAVSSGVDSKESRKRVDDIFKQAVKMGLLCRDDSLDSLWEVDLSGMTLPVARAACRYTLCRLHNLASDARFEDLTFITGVGSKHQRGGTSLRQYVQSILREDFDPPLESIVPKSAQGTVQVNANALVRSRRLVC